MHAPQPESCLTCEERFPLLTTPFFNHSNAWMKPIATTAPAPPCTTPWAWTSRSTTRPPTTRLPRVRVSRLGSLLGNRVGPAGQAPLSLFIYLCFRSFLPFYSPRNRCHVRRDPDRVERAVLGLRRRGRERDCPASRDQDGRQVGVGALSVGRSLLKGVCVCVSATTSLNLLDRN